MKESRGKIIQPTESVANLKPYKNSGYSSVVFEKETDILKLDSNETTIPPSPKVIDALIKFLQNKPINWYPDVDSKKLREKLSLYTGFPADFIQTFNGSDNALECIARTYIEKGDEVVICAPTYDHFRVYIESCGGRAIPVYGPSPFETKPELLVNAVTARTRIIYISNPNNPTGILYTEEQIKYILNNAGNALLIADEAYYEFCKTTIAPLADGYPNIIITRSFSKTFGLAGLRCGYIVAQPEHIKSISKVRIGKNINSLAQVAAIAALDDLDYSHQYVEDTQKAKKWLVDKLSSINLPVVNTPANFILVKVGEPKAVVSFLESRGVFVRDRSEMPHLEGYLRITAAPMSAMEPLWHVIRDIPPAMLIAS